MNNQKKEKIWRNIESGHFVKGIEEQYQSESKRVLFPKIPDIIGSQESYKDKLKNAIKSIRERMNIIREPIRFLNKEAK